MTIFSKPGIKVYGLKPEALFGILICSSVFSDHGQKFTLTSVTDTAPGRVPKTLHVEGLAFDIRTRDLRGVLAGVMASRLREALGFEFTVVEEPDHIHVELDYVQAF